MADMTIEFFIKLYIIASIKMVCIAITILPFIESKLI